MAVRVQFNGEKRVEEIAPAHEGRGGQTMPNSCAFRFAISPVALSSLRFVLAHSARMAGLARHARGAGAAAISAVSSETVTTEAALCGKLPSESETSAKRAWRGVPLAGGAINGVAVPCWSLSSFWKVGRLRHTANLPHKTFISLVLMVLK